jgi:hypothetical protein
MRREPDPRYLQTAIQSNSAHPATSRYSTSRHSDQAATSSLDVILVEPSCKPSRCAVTPWTSTKRGAVSIRG